jgi:hypothetical protein
VKEGVIYTNFDILSPRQSVLGKRSNTLSPAFDLIC